MNVGENLLLVSTLLLKKNTDFGVKVLRWRSIHRLRCLLALFKQHCQKRKEGVPGKKIEWNFDTKFKMFVHSLVYGSFVRFKLGLFTFVWRTGLSVQGVNAWVGTCRFALWRRSSNVILGLLGSLGRRPVVFRQLWSFWTCLSLSLALQLQGMFHYSQRSYLAKMHHKLNWSSPLYRLPEIRSKRVSIEKAFIRS